MTIPQRLGLGLTLTALTLGASLVTAAYARGRKQLRCAHDWTIDESTIGERQQTTRSHCADCGAERVQITNWTPE